MQKHEEKILVIIPTYNEQDNILLLIDKIFNLKLNINILVVDDGEDKTVHLVRQRQETTDKLFLIKRCGQTGRGSAVVEGLKFGLKQDFDYFLEMDADFSHRPEEIPELLKLARNFDIVIASRYIKGSELKNWSAKRRVFSRLANIFINIVLGLGLHDYTNGYRVYTREAVEQLEFDKIESTGYIALSEIAYQFFKKSFKFVERKTLFINRSRGNSKFSYREIKDAFITTLSIKKKMEIDKIKHFLSRNKYPILFFLLVIFLAAIPIIQVILITGSEWQGVPPPYISDDLYYYSRIHEVADGHIFIGNPYFLEHNSEMAPAFFVADWLATLPMILSHSIIFTIVFNLFIWSLITFFLLYKLLCSFKIPKKYSLLGALLCYLQVYWLVLRPVVMQIIFPFMILFWWAFFIWWKEPFKKNNIIFLTLTASFNFYIYSYSWQVVLITFFLTFLLLVVLKEWRKLISLIKINLLTLLLSLPIIIYTLKQISHPSYWETMYRIILTNTHFPAYSAYSYGRWIIIVLVLFFLTILWLNKGNRKTILSSPAFMFCLITGCALLISSVSNIITGKDMQIAGHIARFIILWFSISCVYYSFYFFSNVKKLNELPFKKIIILSLIIVVCFIGIIRNFPRSIPFWGVNFKQSLDVQNYAGPLTWLDKNTLEPSVIWANNLVSNYIPILTKHYVLFCNAGGLHLVSSKEVEERYLISHYFEDLNKEDLKKDFRVYAGAGSAVDAYKVHNRKVKICRLIKLDYFGYNCGEIVDAISYKGDKYFDDLFDWYTNEIKLDINKKLKKFHTAFIIQDKKYDFAWQSEMIKGTQLIYQDERFLIYRISNQI